MTLPELQDRLALYVAELRVRAEEARRQPGSDIPGKPGELLALWWNTIADEIETRFLSVAQ